LTDSQSFDADGNRTSLTDGSGHVFNFTYDESDRVTYLSTPAGRSTSVQYNSLGQVASRTSPSGHVTSYTYDASGQLSQKSDPVGLAAYTYDNDGRVLTETENGVTLTRAYDSVGRLTSYTDGAGNTVGYAYDAAGELVTLTYPDGSQVHYGYDGARRLSSVTDWAGRVTSYSYDGAGRLAQVNRANGSVQTRSYDVAGQLLTLTDTTSSASTIYSNAYAYDGLGRLASETPAALPVALPIANALTFDSDNRLATLNGQGATVDAEGNTISVPTSPTGTFAYDARNRLTSAGTLTYSYDAEGHRIAMNDGTGTTSFVVSPAAGGQVLTRTLPNGSVTKYVYGVGLIYDDTGGAAQFYHYDRRGNLIALTDLSANVAATFAYSAFGSLLSRTGNATTPFMFDGAEGVMTEANGLLYMRFRYYSPALGRFLSEDDLLGTAASPESLNRYAFVANGPEDATDPSGHGPIYGDTPDVQWDSLAAWASAGAAAAGLSGVIDKDFPPPTAGDLGQEAAGDWMAAMGTGSPYYIPARFEDIKRYITSYGPFNAPDSAGTTGPATWGTVLGMFGQWLTGTAPANQMFGPNTPQTQGMMNAPGVQNALNYFYAKNVGNGPDQQQPVVDYGVGFGLSGLVAAGNSPIQQFVGNYRVDLYPNADGNISVQLTNTTSMTSFLYGLWPNSWNPSAGYPGGNYTQHYDWTVPNQNVPNPSRPPGSGASGSW
jgi:RHS repeat-associated protein